MRVETLPASQCGLSGATWTMALSTSRSEAALWGPGSCTPRTCTAAVVANEGGNLASQSVWTLWSDLDNGAFNFPRSMMNTPIPNTQLCPGTTPELPCGLQGQLSSGVAMNA